MTVFGEQPSSAGHLPAAPFDLSCPDPSKPAVALPRYELVPCFYCLMVVLGIINFQGMTCACHGTHYVRIDPERCPILDLTTVPVSS